MRSRGPLTGERGSGGAGEGELHTGVFLRVVPSWMHPTAGNPGDAPYEAEGCSGARRRKKPKGAQQPVRSQRPAGGASDSSSFMAVRKRRTVVSSASLKRARARSVAWASGMK